MREEKVGASDEPPSQSHRHELLRNSYSRNLRPASGIWGFPVKVDKTQLVFSLSSSDGVAAGLTASRTASPKGLRTIGALLQFEQIRSAAKLHAKSRTVYSMDDSVGCRSISSFAP